MFYFVEVLEKFLVERVYKSIGVDKYGRKFEGCMYLHPRRITSLG
jgi:hypothetical protein